MKIAITISIKTGKISKKPIMEDLVSVVAKPTKKAVAKERPIIVVILFIFTIFFNQLAIPKNLKSSSLSPINCTPKGKLFSPVSKGSEIVGKPKYVQIF